MSKSKTIIKDSILFSGSTYFSYIFKIITSLVIRRVLTPTFMGLLSEIMLWNEYSKSHHLGVLNALDREIPYYRGKENFKKIDEVKKTALHFSFCSSLVVMVVLISISLFKIITSEQDFNQGLLLVAFLIIAETISAYYRIILRANNKFMFLSKFNIAFSVVEAVSTIVLIFAFGYKGVLLALILTGIISIIYLIRRSGETIKLGFNFKFSEVKHLLKIGFPLHLYELVRTLFLTIDRLMIIFLLGRTSLGLYSVATLAYNFLTPLPRGVYSVLFPKFYEAYGKTEDIAKVKHYLIKPTMIFAYLFPILIGISYIALPLLVEYILPKYREGLLPAQIFIFSTFFYSLIFMWQFFLIALYKQIKIVQFNLAAVIISVFLNYFFAKILNMNLSGIAIGTTLSHFLLSAALIGYVFSFYSKDIKEHVVLFLKLYFPIAWIGIVILILNLLFKYSHLSLRADISMALMLTGFLGIAFLPLLYYVNKETNILTLGWDMIKGYRKGKNA